MIHLDTFDFQAKDFCLKHGYEIFGVLEDCPENHCRYYLKKKLPVESVCKYVLIMEFELLRKDDRDIPLLWGLHRISISENYFEYDRGQESPTDGQIKFWGEGTEMI